jgi:hypothetical protein
MAKATTNQINSPVARSSAGLRDAIFDEIDAIRGGESNPTRANAVAKLASGIVETVRMELEVQKFANSTAGKVKASPPASALPQSLQLGAA